MSTVLTLSDELINVTDAAKIIGCTPAHVRLLLDRKQIEGEKLHSHAWLVVRKSAQKYAKTPQKTGRPRSRVG